ncbi:hypothetical protein ACW9KT_21715, partial [Hymenobacter sp. HD11105]
MPTGTIFKPIYLMVLKDEQIIKSAKKVFDTISAPPNNHGKVSYSWVEGVPQMRILVLVGVILT